MVYVRGNPTDFDEWAALGATGWNCVHVLPRFRRAYGAGGPLGTCNGNEMANSLYRALIQAGVEAGCGASADANARKVTGGARRRRRRVPPGRHVRRVRARREVTVSVLAERATDLALRNKPLTPVNLPAFPAPDWESWRRAG